MTIVDAKNAACHTKRLATKPLSSFARTTWKSIRQSRCATENEANRFALWNEGSQFDEP